MEANMLKGKIINLYYDKHLKPVEIAKIINKTPQYISKVVKEDERYKIEKEYKHNESLNRKNNIIRNITKLILEKAKKIKKNTMLYLNY